MCVCLITLMVVRRDDRRVRVLCGNAHRYLLEKAAADFEKQRDEATKRRKAEEKETAQRAERRRADVQARLQAEMADLSEQRDAREDLRRLDAARETARRKQLVAEEASAVLGVRLVALERLQKKSELLHRAAEQAAYEQRAQERAERMAESGEGDVSELVLTPDNIAELKTAELREALGMRGVPTIGMIRIDLISRLLEELQVRVRCAACVCGVIVWLLWPDGVPSPGTDVQLRMYPCIYLLRPRPRPPRRRPPKRLSRGCRRRPRWRPSFMRRRSATRLRSRGRRSHARRPLRPPRSLYASSACRASRKHRRCQWRRRRRSSSPPSTRDSGSSRR